jgi:cation:H+ antiporter
MLLISARFFTQGAEKIGKYLHLPSFIIGVFIVGMGTSLPELVSSILSVKQGVSEIVPGNVMGANISNILLITGLVSLFHRKEIVLNESYLFVDLHYLVGSFIVFTIICFDGEVKATESILAVVTYAAYTFYILKSEKTEAEEKGLKKQDLPVIPFLILLSSSLGIYFGADYCISSLTQIAAMLQVPPSIIALTVLSLGTTLPELAVNISAIQQGKAEMAIGNVLGSCIFNSLVVTGVSSFFGNIQVPTALLSFSLPLMCVCGLFFYMLSQDKRISIWEGLLFVLLYLLFIIKIAGLG